MSNYYEIILPVSQTTMIFKYLMGNDKYVLPFMAHFLTQNRLSSNDISLSRHFEEFCRIFCGAVVRTIRLS